MYIAFLLIALASLIYTVPIAFQCWFKPEDFITKSQYRRKVMKNVHFAWLYTPWIRFMENNPSVDLFGFRLTSLVMIILYLFGIYVSIRALF